MYTITAAFTRLRDLGGDARSVLNIICRFCRKIDDFGGPGPKVLFLGPGGRPGGPSGGPGDTLGLLRGPRGPQGAQGGPRGPRGAQGAQGRPKGTRAAQGCDKPILRSTRFFNYFPQKPCGIDRSLRAEHENIVCCAARNTLIIFNYNTVMTLLHCAFALRFCTSYSHPFLIPQQPPAPAHSRGRIGAWTHPQRTPLRPGVWSCHIGPSGHTRKPQVVHEDDE